MDIYTENRFGYLRNLSEEELKKLTEELEEEIHDLLKLLDDDNIPSIQKTDAMNDLKYARERLWYIESLNEENTSEKKI